MIINGKKIAEDIVFKLQFLEKPQKSLAAILVGKNSQSESFLKQKEKIANQLGIKFILLRLSEEISEFEIIKELEKLNKDDSVGGIILQLPLPEKFKKENIISSISPLKDIDALTEESRKIINPLVVEVVNDILAYLNISITDRVLAVVGRGFLIGAPLLDFFKNKFLKMIAMNSKSDINLIKDADIIISGTGKAGLIKTDILKNNAVVIDFGYSLVNGKLKGDFLEDGDLKNISYTPTPGGTGPILVAEIYKNFYKLNKNPA